VVLRLLTWEVHLLAARELLLILRLHRQLLERQRIRDPMLGRRVQQVGRHLGVMLVSWRQLSASVCALSVEGLVLLAKERRKRGRTRTKRAGSVPGPTRLPAVSYRFYFEGELHTETPHTGIPGARAEAIVETITPGLTSRAFVVTVGPSGITSAPAEISGKAPLVDRLTTTP
jgi:hypothetical protein